MSDVLVLLAEGCEEIEAITLIDLLRRGGVAVTAAALRGTHVTGNHGIGLDADVNLDAVLHQAFEMIVLPGGQPGANNLESDARVIALLQRQFAAGRQVAAICAAPKVLKAAGLLENATATSFPGVLDVDPAPGMTYVTDAVVEHGKVITSRGPGTAMDFSLKLLELLRGPGVRADVEERLQRP